MQSFRDFLYKRIARALFYYNTGKHNKKIVFMHIPKTAGTSVNLILKSFYGSSKSEHVSFIDEARLKNKDEEIKIIREANSASFIGGHFGFDILEKLEDRFFTFTFVRNPVERIVSCYNFLSSHRNPQLRIPTMSFDKFLQSDDPRIVSLIRNGQSRQLAKSINIESCEALDDDGIRELALTHIESFDFVGVTENFNHDMNYIIDCLEIPNFHGIVRRNRSADHQRKSNIFPKVNSVNPHSLGLLEAHTAIDRALYDEVIRRRGLVGKVPFASCVGPQE